MKLYVYTMYQHYGKYVNSIINCTVSYHSTRTVLVIKGHTRLFHAQNS